MTNCSHQAVTNCHFVRSRSKPFINWFPPRASNSVFSTFYKLINSVLCSTGTIWQFVPFRCSFVVETILQQLRFIYKITHVRISNLYAKLPFGILQFTYVIKYSVECNANYDDHKTWINPLAFLGLTLNGLGIIIGTEKPGKIFNVS